MIKIIGIKGHGGRNYFTVKASVGGAPRKPSLESTLCIHIGVSFKTDLILNSMQGIFIVACYIFYLNSCIVPLFSENSSI